MEPSEPRPAGSYESNGSHGSDGAHKSAGSHDPTGSRGFTRLRGRFGSRGPAQEGRHQGFVPGGALLHPVALAALALWGLNDHVLKAAWPGWWTGKLSDVASLVAFPLLALAAAQWVWWLARGRRSGVALARGPVERWSRVVLVVAVVATSAVMASINTLPAAARAYEVGLGWLQWPFRGLLAMASGSPWPAPAPAQLWMDPTDLWTLPAALVALWAGWPRGARGAAQLVEMKRLFGEGA